jgi:hypothetical protein
LSGELGFDTGPFVSVVAFCERVLEEKDGTISAIRIIDQFNFQGQGPDAPDAIPEGGLPVTLLVALKAGKARGGQRVQIFLERPDGTTLDGPEISVNFSPGESGGVNLILPMALPIVSAGLYWANVHVNGRLMSRAPMNVTYSFMR